MMEFRNKAAYTALTKSIPKFTQSALSPETLADELQKLDIIGSDTYHSALNGNHDASKRRRDLIIAVMGNGKTGVFQNLVNILLVMRGCEWLGEGLIKAYHDEGGVWTETATLAHHSQANGSTVTQGMQPRYVPHQEPGAGPPLISTHTSHTSHQAGQYGGQVPTGSGIHSNISHPGTGLIPAETKIPEPTMKDLVNEVHTTDPRNFGLQLNIGNYDLGVIMCNNRDRLREQLRCVLNTYLRQTPQPSWYQVALALQNIGDIRNAADIAQKYEFILPTTHIPHAAPTPPQSYPPYPPWNQGQNYSGGPLGYAPPQQPMLVPFPYHLYPPGQPWPYQGGPMPGVHPPTFTQPYTEQIPPAISQLTAPPQSADRVSASVRSTAATHPTAHTPAGRVVQKLKRGDRPNLSTMNKFPHLSGDINILKQVTPKYRQLGNILLNCSNGVEVLAIEMTNNNRVEGVIYDIFQKWLVKDPDATWGKLVSYLQRAGLISLAQDIGSCLE